MNVVAALVPFRIVVVTAWCGLIAIALPVEMDDESYFRDGATALLDGNPWDTYTEVPDLQVGPGSSLVVATLLPGVLLPIAVLACFAGVLGIIDHAHPNRLVLFAGLLVALSWAFLVSAQHLDDALAVLALSGAAADRTGSRLLQLPLSSWRQRVNRGPRARRPSPCSGGGGPSRHCSDPRSCMPPSFLATTWHWQSPSTSRQTHCWACSTSTPPRAWWRAFQLAVMLLVAALISSRGWWPVLVAVTAARISLDPGAWPYVTAPLAGGCARLRHRQFEEDPDRGAGCNQESSCRLARVLRPCSGLRGSHCASSACGQRCPASGAPPTQRRRERLRRRDIPPREHK